MKSTDIPALNDIIREISEIEVELESFIDTTMWISDPHGAGERFVSILKGRFGLVWQTCREALPKTFSNDKIDYLGRLIRKERYFATESYTMERQDVISALVKITQYKVQNSINFNQIRDTINNNLRPFLENLILNMPVPNIMYENDLIAERVISSLCKIVKQVILGHLVVLGDVFDRGDEPDKILRILSQKDIVNYITFIWGNHDILWMGAAAGNKSLIAEALRISTRYDNLDFLKRLDIDIGRLVAFAERIYPDDVTGTFKAKKPLSRKLEKTLAMIQFKLEEKTIRENPELKMESRLWLEKLAGMLSAGDTEGLTDTNFPTLDLANPTELTGEERAVIDDLALQFTRSIKVKALMQFLFEKGKLYHINNFIFNIHALIPSTENGEFEEFLGKRGKELLDHIEDVVKTVGRNYLEDKPQDPKHLALMFYLWCGPKSPFFGKNAMKTFERYFLKDKATHKERLLYWAENLKRREFMDMIMREFGSRRIVYGHTPVDILKGEKIASDDGRAINIDGGFSEAYLNRGHALIHTPYSLYAIILPTPEEVIDSRKKMEPVGLLIETIDTFDEPIRVRDTHKGAMLKKRREELYNYLSKYTS